MTQRIFTLVCFLLIVFHFNMSFAQDDLTLDDAFGSENPTAPTTATDTAPPMDVNPLDSIVDSQAPAAQMDDPFATMTASQNADQFENVNLASPIELRQREGALFGFSAGLMLTSSPLSEDYDKTILSGGQPFSTERVKKQTNAVQHFGVILRYAETPYYRIGTDINISYSKSSNHNSITVKNTETLGEITTLKGEINLSYAIEMGLVPVYFLGGIGFENVTGDSVETMINPSGFGGQIGGGFVINSTINLEAMYAYYVHRVSNALVAGYSAATPAAVIDTEKARVINQGLILRGTFSFNY